MFFVEMRGPKEAIIRASVTVEEYAELGRGVLPTRLGGKGGAQLVRALGGVVRFDTASGFLGAGDWYPGDSELPELIGTESGAALPVRAGMIAAWDGKEATLSEECEAALAAVQMRGV